MPSVSKLNEVKRVQDDGWYWLTTHHSQLTTQKRLEDAMPVRANSRGFLNPWIQITAP